MSGGFAVTAGLGEDEVQDLINASVVAGDLPVAKIYGAAGYTVADTATDVVFGTTTEESDDTVLEVVGNSIEIKDPGLHFLSFDVDIDAPTSNANYQIIATLVHSTEGVIEGAGGVTHVYNDPSIPGNDVKSRISLNTTDILPVGTVSVQISKTLIGGTAGTVNLFGGRMLNVVRLQGSKGDKGDPGAGTTVNVNGTSGITDINFNTDDFEVVISGGDTATVTAKKPFKAHVILSSPVGVNTNNSGWIQALRLSAAIPRAGDYKLSWSYTYSVDNSTASDFLARIEQDDTTEIMLHRQEPKDVGGTGENVTDLEGGTFNSGTDQRPQAGGFDIVTLTAATHNWDLDIQDDAGDTDEPVIYRAVLTIEEWIE